MNGTGSASPDRTAHAEFPSTQWSTILNAVIAAPRPPRRTSVEAFTTLAPLLDGAEPDGYGPSAAQLGMSPGAVAVAIHRMRGRLRELLRAEVRQLCSSAAEEEQEMKHLLEIWSQ